MLTRTALFCLSVLLSYFNNFCLGTKFIKKDQEFINSLLRYEIVYPQLSKDDKDTTTHDDVYVKQEYTLSFRLGGKELTLKLFLNSNLFSVNYFERSITTDGTIVSNKNSHHCYYHGHVVGEESVAAISTCDGISGYFIFSNKTYVVQPVKTVIGEVFHLVFEAEHVNRPKYECGHTKSQPLEILPEISIPKTHRFRRDVLTETKYLEMVIVNDRSQFRFYGNKTAMRTKEIANIIDSVYRVHQIRVILIMIEIWETKDKIIVESDEQKTLDNFEEYKKNILDEDPKTKNDNAQLLTQVRFKGGVVGKASTLSICSRISTGVVNDHSLDTYLTASTMAHELGHNLGLDHDEDFPEKKCDCGNPKGCLMSAHLGSSPLLKLSTCSIDSLKSTLLHNYGTCLFDLPTKHARDPECGNAFLEEGETCDCGPKEHCELIGNTCCNYTTCHLYPQSECSEGPCCENCEFKSKGVVCRDKVNECDLTEYCDGENQLCAPDSYVHNGRPCEDEDGTASICFLGVCHTLTSQCKTLWGSGSSTANKKCYSVLNILGKMYGHCKKLPNKKYLKCAKKDVYCGELQCKDVPNAHLPIIGTSRKGLQTKLGTSISCWIAEVYMGDDIPEPGLVQDGTKCGENKVCSNNTCIDIDVAYEQPKCPTNCSNNGICNNHGHCHCNHGYRPPDCSETCSGIGGSVDSGIGYHCFGEADKSWSNRNVALISVAVIIPLILIIIVIFLICRFREQIRTKLENNRRPPQKAFTTVSYIEERQRSTSRTSSQETLTTPRPTRLDIGGPARNEITITPDRTPGFAKTPPGKPETKLFTPNGSKPASSRPVRPSAPQRPLGPRNSSLPDLLEASPSSVKRPAPPSKSKSFNVADKPIRPRPPAARHISNLEKGSNADVKVPKRPPLRPGEKPLTTSDPFNRSALRKTDSIGDSESSRNPANSSPSSVDSRAPVGHSFRPSDVKAGKSPFASKKV